MPGDNKEMTACLVAHSYIRFGDSKCRNKVRNLSIVAMSDSLDKDRKKCETNFDCNYGATCAKGNFKKCLN